MRGILLAAVSILLMASLPAAAQDADPWAGVWAGAGADNRGDHFQVRIQIYPDGSARAAYEGAFEDATYACGGLLLPMRATRTRRAYREKIINGGCLDEAEVTLSATPGGALGFAWRGAEQGAPVTASTSLRRD